MSKSITFAAPAAPLRILLPQLSKAAGVTLEATAKIADDVMVLKLNGVTVKQAMDRIAEVEVAKWQQEKGRYVLVRSIDAAQRQEQQDLAIKTEVVKRSLEMFAKRAQETSLMGSKGAEMFMKSVAAAQEMKEPQRSNATLKLYDQEPASRAVLEISSHLDPRLLALNDGKRVVFSTSPTPTQLAMPAESGEALAQLIQQEQFISQLVAASGFERHPDFQFVLRGLSKDFHLGKALLIVQNDPSWERSYQLTLFDEKGKQSLLTEAGEQVIRTTEAPPAITTTSDALKFSALTAELAEKSLNPAFLPAGTNQIYSGDKDGSMLVKLRVRADGNRTISPALREFLLNPEQADPLSAAPSEVLTALADQNQVNLVALIPDTCVSTFNRLVSKHASSKVVVADKYFLGRINFRVDKGWFLVSPKLPSFERREAISRKTLGTLCRQVDQDGEITLRNLLDFAKVEETPIKDCYLARMYVSLLNRDPAESERYPDWRVLRFLGSLDDTQFDTLSKGSSLHVSDLREKQLDLLSTWLYDGPEEGFVYLNQGAMPAIRRERTEACPNGVPHDTSLTMKVVNKPCAVGIDPNTGYRELVDAQQIASYRYQEATPEMWTTMGMPPKLRSFIPAQELSYNFRFSFTPEFASDSQLRALQLNRQATPQPYDDLPADFKSQADQLFGRITKLLTDYWKQRKQGTSPQQIPP